LDRIVETKRKEVAMARQAVPLDRLAEQARSADQARDFFGALAGPALHGVHLIAEIKKASPSAGLIRADFDPPAIARLYHRAGAAALSVLTDRSYFQGRLEDIVQVRSAVPLPVLRKDFVIDEYQIYESRRHVADAVLLIAEILDTDTLIRYADLIDDLGMSALIEVHNPEQLDAVIAAVDFDTARRRLLGINNRDLTVQQTDLSTTNRLAARLKDKPLLVSESGIKTRAHVEQVVAAGAGAILVGESLLQADDTVGKIRELLGIGQ
jgi:indole-3-glycerol phosphate synthase